jgi:hypothetical protein
MAKRTVWLLPLVLLAGCAVRGEPETSETILTWSVAVERIPPGAGPVAVWIPVPQALPEQEVADLRVETPHAWEWVEDADHGNRLLRLQMENPTERIDIALSARVRRRTVQVPQPASPSHLETDLYLNPASAAPPGSAVADSLPDEDRARAEYVLQRFDPASGSCTDYHRLFIALSRARGVPARVEVGLSIPSGGGVLKEGRFHCWAWFYRDGAWVALDLLDMDRGAGSWAARRGRLGPDRITFSRGEQVRLPGMQAEPLELLTPFAYVEIDGRPHRIITQQFRVAPAG